MLIMQRVSFPFDRQGHDLVGFCCASRLEYCLALKHAELDLDYPLLETAILYDVSSTCGLYATLECTREQSW